MIRRFLTPVLVSLAVLSTACTSGETEPSPTPGAVSSRFASEVATTDLFAATPQDVQVGLFSSTTDAGVQLVTFGDVGLRFLYLGTDGSGVPEPGPEAAATYVPAPTTQEDGAGPSLSDPATARGVYQAAGVTFDRPGVWTAEVTADVQGAGEVVVRTTAFNVLDEPRLPAPGDRAPKTENHTLGSKGISPEAIDSRAQGGASVPDPELHEWTIADAVAQGRPALVLFATPVHCLSQFCGPSTDALQELARRFPDRAVYIHVEIWKNFDKSVLNQAAADWLYRDGTLSEPWLYLIDGNGVIADRWAPLFDVGEVAAELEALPPMRS